MLRFLVGIFLVQLATVALVFLSPDLQGFAWLRLVFPILLVGVFASFWFQSIAKHKSKDELAHLKDTFVKEKAEREDSYLAEKATLNDKHLKEKAKIQLNAERAKTKIVKQTQKQIAREAKVTHGKANFKVGAAFAAAIGAGALMLLIELFTFGLMTLTTAGGALGGYLLRAKREQKGDALLEKEKLKVITADKTDESATKMPKLLGRLLKR
jgi:cell division protein FtsI/penicillin-binding protein 2